MIKENDLGKIMKENNEKIIMKIMGELFWNSYLKQSGKTDGKQHY